MVQEDLVQIPQEALSQLVKLLQPLTETHYPESDDEPMAETDTHRDEMTDALLHPLKERYRNDPNVYVSGNLFFYYEKGNPQACVAPDVFVVFGVEKKRRRIYQLWEEGKVPDVVFELTLEKTRKNDPGNKRLIYEQLGVREYFLFDPLRDYLQPPLQGFRLAGAYYLPLTPKSLGDDDWELFSETLGLLLRTDGDTLRLFDPQTNHYLLTRGEEAEARRQAEHSAELEGEARRQAEARLQAAEAELARLRTLLSRQQ